jgi:hypothetical protein
MNEIEIEKKAQQRGIAMIKIDDVTQVNEQRMEET